MFEQALTMAQAAKAAAKNVRELHHKHTVVDGSNNVHKVTPDKTMTKPHSAGKVQTKKRSCSMHAACYRCGKPGHVPANATTETPKMP